MTALLKSARRLVVKVGSTLVTNQGRGLDRTAIARWAAQIAQLRSSGKEVVLVSSGAIAEGMQRLGWARRPVAMHQLQAAAADPGRMTHAWLFTGPPGSGRSNAAMGCTWSRWTRGPSTTSSGILSSAG